MQQRKERSELRPSYSWDKTTSWCRRRDCDGKCPDRTPRRRLSCDKPGRIRAAKRERKLVHEEHEQSKSG